MRIDGVRFGIAGGAVLGVGVAFATLLAATTGHGAEVLSQSIFMIYPGYSVTLQGVGIGFIWGAIDGFFGAVIFAWIYNHIHRKHEKSGK